MQTIILGDGPMGRAVAAALAAGGEPPARVLGRPAGDRHPPDDLAGTDVVFEFSRGGAVAANVEAALAAGCRALVVGTTGWEADRERVDIRLRQAGVAAVAAANFSLGVTLFGRLVEEATRLFGALPEYDPFLVEWHRRSKADRPSGTAKELSRRLLAAHPRKQRPAEAGRQGPPAPEELEVVSIRAGASPGMHLVGFDAPGETVELRLTARDRSAYAAGAVEAARWLLRQPRAAGLNSFEPVVDELIAAPSPSSARADLLPASSGAPTTERIAR